MNEIFVSTEWLNTAFYKNFLLLEVGNQAREIYRMGHIPHAHYFDTNWVERPPLWNCIPPAELEQVLRAQGITSDQRVVLYARGTAAAARVGAILFYAGVKEVRLLDGGIEGWLAAGYPVETGDHCPEPVSAFGLQIPARPEVFVDINTVKRMLQDENSLVISVRSWAEYIGKTSGYTYIRPKGRIAGAMWGYAGTNKDLAYTTAEGHALPLVEVAQRWQKVGITPEKRVVFYCGTGWRASEAYFYARALGSNQVSIYNGGWLEWSLDPANPIETGPPNAADG
ncbi:MAG: hypothetical protein Fur0022_13760 [Anaerolineales bacterium]